MNYKIKMSLPLLGMLLLFGYAAMSLKASARMKTFVGGTFEASGVTRAAHELGPETRRPRPARDVWKRDRE